MLGNDKVKIIINIPHLGVVTSESDGLTIMFHDKRYLTKHKTCVQDSQRIWLTWDEYKIEMKLSIEQKQCIN